MQYRQVTKNSSKLCFRNEQHIQHLIFIYINVLSSEIYTPSCSLCFIYVGLNFVLVTFYNYKVKHIISVLANLPIIINVIREICEL